MSALPYTLPVSFQSPESKFATIHSASLLRRGQSARSWLASSERHEKAGKSAPGTAFFLFSGVQDYEDHMSEILFDPAEPLFWGRPTGVHFIRKAVSDPFAMDLCAGSVCGFGIGASLWHPFPRPLSCFAVLEWG